MAKDTGTIIVFVAFGAFLILYLSGRLNKPLAQFTTYTNNLIRGKV